MSIVSCSWAQPSALPQNEDGAELCVYSLDVGSPFEACVTGVYDVEYDDVGLITESRQDDRIIAFRRRCGRAKSKETLLERVSLSTYNGSARLFRCAQTDLPDFLEWLKFQHSEECKIYAQPSFAILENPGALSTDGLRRCSQVISQLLQARKPAQLQLIFLACYIVANSFRELRGCELASAVYEIGKNRFSTETEFMREEDEFLRLQKLLKMLWTVMRIQENSRVSFNEPYMKNFLQSISLPGIEGGHGTMAQLCLSEIRKFGDTLIVQPWHKFRKWFGSCSSWPLMRYTTKYWSCHVREAAPSRSDITAQLHQMINYGVAGRSPRNTPIYLQKRVIEIGYSVSKVYDLPCLALLYENLGAVGNLPLFQVPTMNDLQHWKMVDYCALQPDDSRCSSEQIYQPILYKIAPRSSTAAGIKFERLHLRSQRQSKRSKEAELTPEDLDWEQVNLSDKRSDNVIPSNDGDSWTLVTHEDHEMQ